MVSSGRSNEKFYLLQQNAYMIYGFTRHVIYKPLGCKLAVKQVVRLPEAGMGLGLDY